MADASGIDELQVSDGLAQFVGRIVQRPPAYSAVKVGGRRAYRVAREGGDPRPEPREVEVYSARLLELQPGPEAVARIEVVCASGTYLRSIARDLGDKLGVGGYLGRLVRTAYGGLRREDSVSLDSLTGKAAVEAALLSPEAVLPEMQPVRLNLDQEAMVRQGRAVRVLPEPGPGPLRAHGADGRLVALGHADPLRRTFVPDKVLT